VRHSGHCRLPQWNDEKPESGLPGLKIVDGRYVFDASLAPPHSHGAFLKRTLAQELDAPSPGLHHRLRTPAPPFPFPCHHHPASPVPCINTYATASRLGRSLTSSCLFISTLPLPSALSTTINRFGSLSVQKAYVVKPKLVSAALVTTLVGRTLLPPQPGPPSHFTCTDFPPIASDCCRTIHALVCTAPRATIRGQWDSWSE